VDGGGRRLSSCPPPRFVWKDKENCAFGAGSRRVSLLPKQTSARLSNLHERAVGAEVLAPAQLSGECLPCLVKCRRPQKSCLSGAQHREFFFAAGTNLARRAFVAARKSQNLCSNGEATSRLFRIPGLPRRPAGGFATAQWRLAMTWF